MGYRGNWHFTGKHCLAQWTFDFQQEYVIAPNYIYLIILQYYNLYEVLIEQKPDLCFTLKNVV